MSLHALENDPEYIRLQIEMVKMQQWVMDNKKKVVIILEGRDTAGKGGAIMRFIRFINPRGYRIVALNKPTPTEQGQWYFKRYVAHLPDPGELVFFDRSWYNRAVVEPVMGFCTSQQYDAFMHHVIPFERMLLDSDHYIFKLWFSISKEEQETRLAERHDNPLIGWKLSTVDMQAQMKWDDFTHYKEKMFQNTGTPDLPWVIIDGNNKDLARKEAMRYILNRIPYENKGISGESLEFDNSIVKELK